VFVSVLIPAFNEAAIIERTLSTVRDHLSARSDAYSWEMLVVDDGSTDGTGALADAFAAGDERVRVLHHRTNFGLGQALRYGFAQAHGDVVVTLDADLTYSVDHIDRLLDAFTQTGAKIVVASPYAQGGATTDVPFRRLLPSRVANVLLAAASNAHVSTITGMVRAYDTRLLRSLNVRAMGMDINSEILRQAQILRARIVEIPAHLDWSGADRGAGGSSSLRMPRTTIAIAISAFLFRPVMFFMVPAVALALFAAAAWIWAVAAGLGGFRLLAAVAIVASLAAIQFAGFAFLALQAKRSFEDLFVLGTATYRSHQEGSST
jgi:glycosyltransferase involved in cell wall biosynthesis